MKHCKERLVVIATGVLLALAGAAFVSDALAQQAEARKDLVLNGDAKCTRCHDAEDNPKILEIGQTKHGVRGDGRTPTCTSCHGESDTHVNKPANATERRGPIARSPSARRRRSRSATRPASGAIKARRAPIGREALTRRTTWRAAIATRSMRRTTRCARRGHSPRCASPATRSSARR